MRVCSIWQTLAVLKPWLACIHAALLCMSCLYDIPVLWNFQLLWVDWLIEKGVCNLMLHGRLQGLHSRTSGQLTAHIRQRDSFAGTLLLVHSCCMPAGRPGMRGSSCKVPASKGVHSTKNLVKCKVCQHGSNVKPTCLTRFRSSGSIILLTEPGSGQGLGRAAAGLPIFHAQSETYIVSQMCAAEGTVKAEAEVEGFMLWISRIEFSFIIPFVLRCLNSSLAAFSDISGR